MAELVLKIHGNTLKWLSSNDQQPIWLRLNNGQMLHNPGVKFLEIYPESLTAVITAKGASTKYWFRGVNSYVNLIFLYFIFNKCAKMSKNMFMMGEKKNIKAKGGYFEESKI